MRAVHSGLLSFDSLNVGRALLLGQPALFHQRAVTIPGHLGEVTIGLRLLQRGPELAIVSARDHGGLLRTAGLARRALQYEVGNPLTATRMTQHRLSAALYAPLRILLYENGAGRAVFEYDRPSSLFGQFGDERVTAVGRELDSSLERVLAHALS